MAISDWLIPSKKTGVNNSIVSLQALQNIAASRSTIVTVTVDGIIKTVNCNQVEAPKFTLTVFSETRDIRNNVIANVGECSIGYSATDGIKSKVYYENTRVTITAMAPPAKYNFAGWYLNQHAAFYELQGQVGVYDNLTLHALYRTKSYLITAESEDINKGTVNPKSQIIERDAYATLVATPILPYAFEGWYINNVHINSEHTWTFPFNSDRHVVAKFIIITFITTTANTAGGTASVNVGSVNYGGSATWTAYPSTGYSFVNWNNGNTNVSFTISNITANQHWYPTFAINFYTVTWNPSNGVVSPTSTTGAYGTALGTLPIPTRATTAEYSYSFQGWFTSSSGGSRITADTIIVSNVTYYARWISTKRTYTVSFNGNGGNNVASIIREYGTALSTLSESSRTGHTFLGWWTLANGGTEVSAATIVYSDITYYAHWSINNYTLYYNANGGLVSPTSKVIQYGNTYGTLPTPTRANTSQYSYRFVGWFTNASGGTEVSASTIIGTSNVTIYAQWVTILNNYTLTVTNGSGGGTYSYGTIVTLTAYPIDHYIFTGWSDGVTSVSRQVTVVGNATYIAQYKDDSHTISLNSNSGGTVSGGGTFTHGTTITITAQPIANYAFVSWSDGGARVHNIFVDNDKTLTATFVKVPYLNLSVTSITFEAEGGTKYVDVDTNTTWTVS